MKLEYSMVIVACVLWQATAYPAYYPYYGGNFDTLSYGSSDNTRGGMVLSRYYNPYYNPRSGGAGMAAFMFKQPEEQPQVQQAPSQYYLPDRRRQTQEENFFPQQNEVYYPQAPPAPEKPLNPTETTELADPTEKIDLTPTTVRAVVPELVEPEVEEVEEPVKPKKRVSKRKQVKKPIEDEEDDDDYQPKMPTGQGAFFPMFFGWGGRGSSGGMPGATAIANAYSTGRGGVATSHATAYGPRPDYTDFKKQP